MKARKARIKMREYKTCKRKVRIKMRTCKAHKKSIARKKEATLEAKTQRDAGT